MRAEERKRKKKEEEEVCEEKERVKGREEWQGNKGIPRGTRA